MKGARGQFFTFIPMPLPEDKYAPYPAFVFPKVPLCFRNCLRAAVFYFRDVDLESTNLSLDTLVPKRLSLE